MASAKVSAPTRSARLGGLTPGPRPGAHRDQPPHLTVVHGTGGVVPKPRGTAPGSTHPDLHALAIRATVKRPCAPAAGTRDPHGLCRGVRSDAERSLGWVNPGPTARGSPRPTPTPDGRARPDELSVDPGAHRDQPPHRRAERGSRGASVDVGAASRRAATDAHRPEPRGMAPGLAYPDCTRSRQQGGGRRGHARPAETRLARAGAVATAPRYRPRNASRQIGVVSP